MMDLRRVGALLAISTVVACATATYDAGMPGPSTNAGADSGGSAGLAEEGGAPAGGAPEGGAPAGGAPQTAGAPGGAGKGSGGSGNGSGGSGTAGKGGGTAGAVGKGGSASGGAVGVAGASGSNMGGKAGTGSSGAGGSAAGSPGSAGGTGIAPCDNAKDVATGKSGNFGTKAAVCLRTKESFNTVGGCYNWDGRTIKVNGVLATCGTKATFPAAIDTWNYFDVSAGDSEFAGFTWFNQ